MFFQRIDYDQLKAIMRDRLTLQPASWANLVSALTEFLRERGIASSDAVGSTLRADYGQELLAHLATLRKSRSRGYIKNRRALLAHWHRLIRDLDHEGATVDGTETPIQAALQLFMRGRRYTTTARLVGMSSNVLENWVKRGSVPKPTAIHFLTRIEELGALPVGTFTGRLPTMPVARRRPKKLAGLFYTESDRPS